MQISTKFRVAAVACLLLAVFVGTLPLWTPEGNQRLLQGARAIPNWIALGFMLLVLALFVFIFKIFWLDLPRAGAKTKSLAEQVSKKKWYVKEVSMFEHKTVQRLDSKGWREIEHSSSPRFEGAAVFELCSTDRNRQKLTLPIRPAHPSVKELRRLSYLDIVEFEFVEKSLECALDTEFCAYLVLKT